MHNSKKKKITKNSIINSNHRSYRDIWVQRHYNEYERDPIKTHDILKRYGDIVFAFIDGRFECYVLEDDGRKRKIEINDNNELSEILSLIIASGYAPHLIKRKFFIDIIKENIKEDIFKIMDSLEQKFKKILKKDKK